MRLPLDLPEPFASAVGGPSYEEEDELENNGEPEDRPDEWRTTEDRLQSREEHDRRVGLRQAARWTRLRARRERREQRARQRRHY